MQNETDAIEIQRKFGVSVLLGMGLTREVLRLQDDCLLYEGVEFHWGIWRMVRVRKMVFLKDIVLQTKSFVVHPVLIALAGISLVNVLASILELSIGWRWWFELGIWRLPYLGMEAIVARLVELAIPNVSPWLPTHVVTFVLYAVAIFLMKRQYLIFGVDSHPTIRFRVDGVTPYELVRFETSFASAWLRSKTNATST